MSDKPDYVTKEHFDEVIGEIKSKLIKLDKIEVAIEKLDWLMGKYRDHDEEHTLLNNKVSEHSDNLELINAKVGIQA